MALFNGRGVEAMCGLSRCCLSASRCLDAVSGSGTRGRDEWIAGSTPPSPENGRVWICNGAAGNRAVLLRSVSGSPFGSRACPLGLGFPSAARLGMPTVC
jgi:hypothetical protein